MPKSGKSRKKWDTWQPYLVVLHLSLHFRLILTINLLIYNNNTKKYKPTRSNPQSSLMIENRLPVWILTVWWLEPIILTVVNLGNLYNLMNVDPYLF